MRNPLILAASMTAAAATASTPVMGWSSFRVDISDSLIIRQAEALVSTGLSDAGYDHINVDDGFFGHRAADGRMQPHPTRFPGGMKCVAERIHSLGLNAELYSYAEAVTCGSIWDNDTIGRKNIHSPLRSRTAGTCRSARSCRATARHHHIAISPAGPHLKPSFHLPERP